jgi:hypothetical protein
MIEEEGPGGFFSLYFADSRYAARGCVTERLKEQWCAPVR